MSKKKPRRPGRRARLEQRMQERRERTRSTLPPDGGEMLAVAPWTVFDHIDADLDDQDAEQARAVAAHLPFRLGGPDSVVSLAFLADSAGVSVEEQVKQMRWMAERGYLWWDEAGQTVVPTIPERP
ncbi:hypothetical protein [Nonomuraea sp. SYSU D8015]|uniref:hypothetical protein n=1 Tax=Nonomuraea sp. SYSU D8015 TaxID=2593644 RepID=UPI0016608D65|nr:hypothetical protein [Nonomuraea sp. SYSU D8015]